MQNAECRMPSEAPGMGGKGWNPCNLADPSAVHIFNSGRFGTARRSTAAAHAWRAREAGSRGGREASNKLATGLQHACNLLATMEALQRYSGVGPALHRLNFLNSLASLAAARRHRSA